MTLSRPNIAAVFVLAIFAIAAFAGNSLLARAALADGTIEAGAFSAIRLASGAIVLLPFLSVRPSRKDLPGAFALAAYVAGFSLAYLDLSAGLGALILFGFVQATIIFYGLFKGERIGRIVALGIALALAGLVWVLAPWRAASPDDGGLAASVLMAGAGIAWGAYTVIGRGSAALPGGASGVTARSFLMASLIVLPMIALDDAVPSTHGVLLAVLSGTVTSALGYVIWYKVAPQLGIATVASVQLATPVAAAAGGVIFLAENLTFDVIFGGGLVLSGILLTLKKP